MANTTVHLDLPPLPEYSIKPLPPLISGLPDQYLALILPILAYWVVSMIFHFVDEWDLFPQYRLHTPAEVLKRNHVSRWDVFRDVILQQIIQTIVGVVLALIDSAPTYGREEYDVAWWAQMVRLAQRAIPGVLATIGIDAGSFASKILQNHAMVAGALAGGIYPDLVQTIEVSGEYQATPVFAAWEMFVARAVYFVLVPAVQFFVAILVVDTWQYFLHRAMHMNKWLYTTFHSRHHRLYVPYAYGALYNHPFEGFLLDTLGTGVAYLVSGMSCRQSMWFFTMSTIKTVDDHCGYAFPWDPLQHLTSNNAGYHDVHHQSWGIKTNFSQPFFTFWDSFLGTKWTGGDVSARYERARLAALRKVNSDATITKAEASMSSTAQLQPYQKKSEEASLVAQAVSATAEPQVPPGKASLQALDSRQQIIDDRTSGGVDVIVDESIEEVRAQQKSRATTRQRRTASGLRALADTLGDSLHGKGTGVLGVESRST